MARNCPSCGRANDDDARFCSGCGAEIASSEPVPAAAPPAPASPAGQVPPAPPPAMAQGAGGPPRKGPSPALLIVIIVLVVAAAAAAAVFFFIMPAGSDGGGETTPTPVASSGSAAPTPSAGEFLAAAVGRQGNVLGTVAADGAVKELATTLGPQIFQIAYSPDGKRIACIAGDGVVHEQLGVLALALRGHREAGDEQRVRAQPGHRVDGDQRGLGDTDFLDGALCYVEHRQLGTLPVAGDAGDALPVRRVGDLEDLRPERGRQLLDGAVSGHRAEHVALAADGRQGNVLGTVTADGRGEEPA